MMFVGPQAPREGLVILLFPKCLWIVSCLTPWTSHPPQLDYSATQTHSVHPTAAHSPQKWEGRRKMTRNKTSVSFTKQIICQGMCPRWLRQAAGRWTWRTATGVDGKRRRNRGGGVWVEGIHSPCPDLNLSSPTSSSLGSSLPEVYEKVTKLRCDKLRHFYITECVFLLPVGDLNSCGKISIWGCSRPSAVISEPSNLKNKRMFVFSFLISGQFVHVLWFY